MDDQVGAEAGRVDQEGRGEGVVDDRPRPVAVGQLDDRRDVGDAHQRVGDRLEEHRPRLRPPDRRFDLRQVEDVDEGRLHPERGEDVGQHGVGGAVEVAGGDDLVAGLDLAKDGDVDRAHPGAEGDRVLRPFEGGDRRFQGAGGRIAVAGVDVPRTLVAEDGVLGRRLVVDEGGGGVDRRHGRREVRARRSLPGVDGATGEAARRRPRVGVVAVGGQGHVLLAGAIRPSARGTCASPGVYHQAAGGRQQAAGGTAWQVDGRWRQRAGVTGARLNNAPCSNEQAVSPRPAACRLPPPVEVDVANASEDGFLGCLLGLAIGDALGMAVEGWPRERIAARYGAINDYHLLVLPDGRRDQGRRIHRRIGVRPRDRRDH